MDNKNMLDTLLFELPKQPFKNEKSFTAWFGKTLHSKGGMWHKISDMSVDQKPSDAIFALAGIAGLVEIKHGKEKKRVDVGSKLRPNQHFGLRRFQENGGLSVVIYYNETVHKYYVMEYQEDIKLFLSE